MKNSVIWIAVILIIAIGGYVWAFIEYRNNNALERQLLNDDLDNIGLIDEELKSIRKSKEITLDDLEKSRKNIEKLIEAAKSREEKSLDVDDALDLIGELE